MHVISRYAGWISLPLLAAGAAFWLGLAGRSPAHSGLLPADPKLRRTLKLFDMAAFAGSRPAGAPRLDHHGLHIDISMDPQRLELMRVRDNRRYFKVRTTDVALSFDGESPMPATLVLRGASTLKSSDKMNFNIELLRRLELGPGLRFKQFYLIAMAQDPHEIATCFGYRVLGDMGLFFCHYQYVRVSINDQPEGMYLLVEPPAKAIRRCVKDVVAVHRRQKPNIYETYWTDGRYNATASLRAFQTLNISNRLDDAAAQYASVLDLESYLSWTAVNSIVLNNDTLDEVYLYERRQPGKETQPAPLAVMGWDCDDLAARAPLPKTLNDPLLYSCMDRFDQVIQREGDLYDRYRRTLARLLRERLTTSYLMQTLDSVQRLRDSLDDGLPADVQQRRRQDRQAQAQRIRELLVARHAELLERVKDVPPPVP